MYLSCSQIIWQVFFYFDNCVTLTSMQSHADEVVAMLMEEVWQGNMLEGNIDRK